MPEFLKFLIAGVINTIIGYGVFLFLFKLFNLHPEIANAFGYCIGLVSAFILNKIFVFQKAVSAKSAVPRFMVSFLFAFFCNQAVLILFHRYFGIRAEFAQIFAMATYTIIFFMLNKFYVFPENTLKKLNSNG